MAFVSYGVELVRLRVRCALWDLELELCFKFQTPNETYGNFEHLDARIYQLVSSWGFKAGIPVKQRNHFSYSQLIAAKTHPDGTPMA